MTDPLTDDWASPDDEPYTDCGDPNCGGDCRVCWPTRDHIDEPRLLRDVVTIDTGGLL